MFFLEDCTYHIYNRSNETLFYTRENYIFFIRKIRDLLSPLADVLAYCIMPNHFHLILTVKKEGVKFSTKKKREDMQLLPEAIGTVLSSYTQAINKQQGRRGSLFAHKTKAKILNDAKNDYAFNCFMYVHQNPKLADLVERIEDWEFSSFLEYIGKRNGTLVNVQMGLDIFNLDKSQIYGLTYKLLQDKFDEDFI